RSPARGRAAAQRRRPRRPGSLRRYAFAWPCLCAPDEAATNDSAYRSRRQPVSRVAKVAGRPVHVADDTADATTRLGRSPVLSCPRSASTWLPAVLLPHQPLFRPPRQLLVVLGKLEHHAFRLGIGHAVGVDARSGLVQRRGWWLQEIHAGLLRVPEIL